MKGKLIKPNTLGLMVGISGLIFFACSSFRHALFESTAFDLAIFDQAIYLISLGQPPISSFLGFHILADHAAWLLYPLGLLYKIHPDVHWLFAVQAAALAVGILPVWGLARQAGLNEPQAATMASVYLLYPLVFNINLYDFHLDVIAPTALLWAVLAARLNQVGWFVFCIVLVLGCKGAFSLTIAAMGVWLLLFERKYLCGTIALSIGVAWLLIVTQVILPTFGGDAATVERFSWRYGELGNSLAEIAKNFVLKPELMLGKIISLETLKYLFKLFLPVLWGVSFQCLAPLVSAIPVLLLNILAHPDASQRDLVYQYSLPVLPFLLIVVISSLAKGKAWLANRRAIILWSVVIFLYFSHVRSFKNTYLSSLDTWQATREAIALVKPQGSVLTTDRIAPHLSQRPLINQLFQVVPPVLGNAQPANVTEWKYILLNVRYPGWSNTPEYLTSIISKLKNDKLFQLRYQRDDVYLFEKQSS